MTTHTRDSDAKIAAAAARDVLENIGWERLAALEPAATAIIDVDGTTWTRAALAQAGHGFASALVAAGLSSRDAVAIVAPNCAEYVAACLGALAAGFDVVPVNWHLSEDELAFVLRDSAARAVLAHAALGEARLALIARSRLPGMLLAAIGGASGFAPFAELVSQHAHGAVGLAEPGRLMAYTSATTGRPKAVVLPRANARTALARLVAWQRSLELEPGNRHVHLCTSMLYHTAPLKSVIAALETGHRVVLTDRPAPPEVLDLIERYGVTTSFMAPTLFVRLLKLPDARRARFSPASLELVMHGGAPCPVEVKRAMLDWWGPVVWESYGAVEVQGTIASPADWLRHPGTVGRPIPGSAIRILDDLGEPLVPNRVGTIYLRPFTGDRFEYRNDPASTRASYSGEFITAGDVGYINDEGYLFICDRRADLIISSGMNIYPAEIEQALVQHAAVADCGVIGESHALFGQVPVAVVELQPGAAPSAALSTELLRFLARKLAPMKLPRRIEYRRSLPRDPNGKLRRPRLREALADHSGRGTSSP